MSLLSWFFPSPADRLAAAHRLMSRGRIAEARLELLDNPIPEATELLHQAENQLAKMNLEEALRRGESGDDLGASEHLELAERFHHGGLEEGFRQIRRALRDLRLERKERAKKEQDEKEARHLAMEPGVSSESYWTDDEGAPSTFDGDRDEIEARLALLVENYPEDLRPTVRVLGSAFARAVLEIDDAHPDVALHALLELPEDQPLVRWERARAAHALGDPKAARNELRQLKNLTGRYHVFGQRDSGSFLAQCLAVTGDLAEGLTVMRDTRAQLPNQGNMLFAQLLEATQAYKEAEKLLVKLCKDHPRQPMFFLLLARVRMKTDHRMKAMQALEAYLKNTHCSPGTCGYQPPHPRVIRTLAILYLEDGVELDRGCELAHQARTLVDKPQWQDLYLSALLARREHPIDVPRLREVALKNAPAQERERIEKHLRV
jgi:tetratricopeptide (TPR) repeat protein